MCERCLVNIIINNLGNKLTSQMLRGVFWFSNSSGDMCERKRNRKRSDQQPRQRLESLSKIHVSKKIDEKSEGMNTKKKEQATTFTYNTIHTPKKSKLTCTDTTRSSKFNAKKEEKKRKKRRKKKKAHTLKLHAKKERKKNKNKNERWHTSCRKVISVVQRCAYLLSVSRIHSLARTSCSYTTPRKARTRTNVASANPPPITFLHDLDIY